MPSPKERTHAAEYAAHLEQVRRSSWRLGLCGGWWCVAKLDADTDGWTVLDEQLEAFDDIDPAAKRRRVVAWLYELLDVRSIVLDRDWEAHTEGRVVFAVTVQG